MLEKNQMNVLVRPPSGLRLTCCVLSNVGGYYGEFREILFTLCWFLIIFPP